MTTEPMECFQVGDWITYQEGFYEKKFGAAGVPIPVPSHIRIMIEYKKIPRQIIEIYETLVVRENGRKLIISDLSAYRKATTAEVNRQRLKEMFRKG